MEKVKDRIFAYNLAKEISNEELTHVSGGAFGMTTKECARASGGSGQGVDFVLDVVLDW